MATSRLDPAETTSLYRRRWEVETMSAALKSRVFNLEETHLTAPDRVDRLIGLLALTFGWTHLAGEKRAAREGPPLEKTHGRRAHSLFRYGLGWLQSMLTTPLKNRTQRSFRV
ncbi:transposase [Salinibacter ruber]|uniref:transposase n=1 Tax=Salinibacter ruber TaxID=146919 RepID=UPI003C6E6EEA